jgi:hypothetical protein
MFHEQEGMNKMTKLRLLKYLTIADLLTAFGNFLGVAKRQLSVHVDGDQSYEVLCIVQSFITTTASLWMFYWMMAISIYYLYHAAAENGAAKAETWMKRLPVHAFFWGFPGIFHFYTSVYSVKGHKISFELLRSQQKCTAFNCEIFLCLNSAYQLIKVELIGQVNFIGIVGSIR